MIVESPTKAKTIGKYLGAGLRREGHHRPRPRPPDPRARRRRRARVRAQVRHHQGQDQDAGRAQEGGQDRVHHLSRHRPRPRGRGHRLARGRAARRRARRPTGCCSTRSPRTPSTRRWSIRADRRPQGERPAGAPHPGPAGRLQGEPDPLAQHQDRPVGRPGPDRRPPAHRRARARDPRVHAAGVLEHRGAAAPRTGRPSRPRWPRSAGTSRSSTPPRRRRRSWTRCGDCRSSSPRSRSATAGRTPPRRSPPAPSSRRPPRSSASARGAPCARRRTCTRAWTSARTARSASSPTCGPTRSGCRTRRSPRCASSSGRTTRSRTCPTRRTRYSSRKNARVQDAHEAIRPTDVRRRPEQVQ